MMSDRKSPIMVLCVLLGALALGACSSQSSLPGEAVTTPVQEVAATGTAVSGSGAPAHPDASWEALPEQGHANVRGTIQLASPNVLLGELFLATAMPTNQPEVDVLELDTETAPRASLDRETGRFVFKDVKPGKYGVIAWEPMSSAALADPTTGETLFLGVAADAVLDVGTLRYP